MSGAVLRASLLALGLTLTAACGGGAQTHEPATAAQRLNGEGLRRLERGDIEGAEALFHDALREGELVDDLQAQAEAWNNLGSLAMAQGNTEAAIAAHSLSLRLHAAKKSRDAGEIRARSNLGSALLLARRPDEARAQFQAAIELATQLGEPQPALMARVGLAAVAVQRDTPQEAARLASEATGAARKQKDDASLAAALSVEGAALELAGDLTGASAKLEEALNIDRAREQPLNVEADLLALARLAERRGDRPAASSLLARASRVARRLGRFEQATDALTRAIALSPGGAEANALRNERSALEKARAE